LRLYFSVAPYGCTNGGSAVRASGYAVVPNTVLRHPGLSDGAVRLYAILLGWRPQPNGTVIASHELLGEAAGHQRNWARAKTAELAAARLLIWETDGPRGKRGHTRPTGMSYSTSFRGVARSAARSSSRSRRSHARKRCTSTA
jgi:hypothetical protein